MSETPNSMAGEASVGDLAFLGLPGVYVAKGAHIAHFFDEEQDRFSILAPFLKAGLEVGDRCLIVTPTWVSPLIKQQLNVRGVEVDPALDSGQLVLSDGDSRVEEMAYIVEDFIRKARSDGRRSVRVAGDMTWVLSRMRTAEKLLEFEAVLDKYLGSRTSCVVLCQFDHRRLTGSVVMGALRTHPHSIIGNMVEKNPFHLDPLEILQELPRRVGPKSR